MTQILYNNDVDNNNNNHHCYRFSYKRKPYLGERERVGGGKQLDATQSFQADRISSKNCSIVGREGGRKELGGRKMLKGRGMFEYRSILVCVCIVISLLLSFIFAFINQTINCELLLEQKQTKKDKKKRKENTRKPGLWKERRGGGRRIEIPEQVFQTRSNKQKESHLTHKINCVLHFSDVALINYQLISDMKLTFCKND